MGGLSLLPQSPTIHRCVKLGRQEHLFVRLLRFGHALGLHWRDEVTQTWHFQSAVSHFRMEKRSMIIMRQAQPFAHYIEGLHILAIDGNNWHRIHNPVFSFPINVDSAGSTL